MSTTAIAAFLRPLVVLALMALVVIPIELVLKRFWPEGRLKTILFDRTFRDRHPWRFMVVWVVLMALLIAFMFGIYLSGPA